jgi:hypothetical protein
MIKYPNLIPECNVDTVFVEMLGYKNPNHAPDINQVALILNKKKTNEKAIGFIDDDKKSPLYFKEFKQLDKIGDVKLLKHSKRNHYLVVVSPAMDNFIYNLGKSLGVKNLPNTAKEFRLITKKQSIKNNPDFKNLLNTIIQKMPEEIITIKLWISKYSPYQT